MTGIVRPAEDVDMSAFVRPGETVLWAQATGEPVALTSQLFDQREAIGGFRCFLGLSLPGAPRPEPDTHVHYTGYGALGTTRTYAEAGVLDVLVSPYSYLPGLIRSRRFAVDVVMLLLPPADEDGTHSIGLADEYVSSAIDAARVVLAEVNANVPRTASTRRVPTGQLDLVVHSNRPLLEATPSVPRSIERAIAAQAAQVIPDGATLQLGLGSLPLATLDGLDGHRDLGVHSGMIGDAVADLMEAGTITNRHKPIDRGVTIAGLVLGSRRLFDFVDGNPLVSVRGTSYTHDPTVLASLPALTALNSAMEVDLTGAINAEAVGARYVGAVGGAGDFLRGAHHSPGGLPVILLPSTVKDRSRVVARLHGPVSTARADAGLVVTEHGVADLRGATVSERVERMLEVADPAHRTALAEEAERILRGDPLAEPPRT